MAMLSPRFIVIFCALLLALAQHFDMASSYVLLVILVALFGVPHGLFDPWIAKLTIHRQPKTLGFFCLCYLVMAGAVFYFWLILPMWSLILFLIISSIHFGADWVKGDSRLQQLNTALLCGGSVIALPLLFSPQQSFSIFSLLVGQPIFVYQELIWTWLGLATLYMVIHRHANAVIDLLLLTLLAAYFEPLSYFMLYFCAMHSMHHYQHHWPIVKQNILDGKWVFIGIILSTIILALMGFNYLHNGNDMDTALLQLLFYGLAALTVPHMMIMAYKVKYPEA